MSQSRTRTQFETQHLNFKKKTEYLKYLYGHFSKDTKECSTKFWAGYWAGWLGWFPPFHQSLNTTVGSLKTDRCEAQNTSRMHNKLQRVIEKS